MITLRTVVNVYYFVDDLPAAVTWYGELLGAEPVETYGERLATFAVGDTRFTLHDDDSLNSNAGSAGTVAYWDVDDVDATVAAFVEKGAVAHRGPATLFTGDRLCQLLDPFGVLIGVRQAKA